MSFRSHIFRALLTDMQSGRLIEPHQRDFASGLLDVLARLDWLELDNLQRRSQAAADEMQPRTEKKLIVFGGGSLGATDFPQVQIETDQPIIVTSWGYERSLDGHPIVKLTIGRGPASWHGD